MFFLRYWLDFSPPDPANFSALPRSGKNFSARPEASGKIKNVNFIKSAKTCDGAKRKRHTIFFVLRPILFKLLPIYSQLKLVSAVFYQIFIFSPNDRPSKTMKSVFYFVYKALFVLEIFKVL